jgi:small subunit ribosomal protein S17
MENNEVKIEKKRVERQLQGVVVATKNKKTVNVQVERIFQHDVYKKIMRRRSKYMAHDEKNECKLGDIVIIKLVRPLSKNKRWLVIKVVVPALVEKEVAL